jgi:hypothetical protein
MCNGLHLPNLVLLPIQTVTLCSEATLKAKRKQGFSAADGKLHLVTPFALARRRFEQALIKTQSTMK